MDFIRSINAGMNNDLGLTFREIFNGDTDAFRDQLIDIQFLQASRDASEKWVQKLRFLDVSDAISRLEELEDQRPASKKRKRYQNTQQAGRLRHRPRVSIPLTRKKDDTGDDTPYIAVSWKWGKPRFSGSGASFDYRIQRPGRRPHKSSFPDCYLERVIQFASLFKVHKIWVDKECIYQEIGDSPKDKNLGLQIMDVVYGKSQYSAGLLQTAIMDQKELDALAALLSFSIFVNKKPSDVDEIRFRNEADLEAVENIIEKLLDDPRWDRAWIFQEDHLASVKMRLLIPCPIALRRGNLYNFGTIPKDLLVEMAVFKQAVTMFCVASGDEKHAFDFLSKVKQYNIWNKRTLILHSEESSPPDSPTSSGWSDGSSQQFIRTNSNISGLETYPSTTLSILEDICNRDLEKQHDRIAILANAAKFSARLDVGNKSVLARSGKYSLSTALLALILMNGEILRSDIDCPPDEVLDHTLQDYLEMWEYEFHGPSSKFEQSFIDHCRLTNPIITPDGVCVNGFLYHILPEPPSKTNPLKLTKRDRDNLRPFHQSQSTTGSWSRRRLSILNEEVIQIVINRLRKIYGPMHDLAGFLEENLEYDRLSRYEHPLTKYMLDIMSAVASAIYAGRDVRLARLEHESDFEAPSAMFIAPPVMENWPERELEDGTTEYPRVFVSWSKGIKDRGMERLACLDVTINDCYSSGLQES